MKVVRRMLTCGCGAGIAASAACSPPADAARSIPRVQRYVAYRAPEPIVVDGHLDDAAWAEAPWTAPFVDIEGDRGTPPAWRTQVKMLWDSVYFYVAAELEEPHLWGTLVTRDTIVFHDDDFEVFVDPDGDTHAYYELEINALGTVWDLLLEKPYRDGGPPVTAWDVDGLRSAVAVQGTLNDPSDTDSSWTVELALPWAGLAEHAPEGRGPRNGEQWRVNFSRVEWELEVVGGAYAKRRDAVSGDLLPERNWVWSPQGAINMHLPERWGVVQFSDAAAGTAVIEPRAPEGEAVRWYLRELYYAQRAYRASHGAYTDDPALLAFDASPPAGATGPIRIRITADGYEARVDGGPAGLWSIRADGRVWREGGE